MWTPKKYRVKLADTAEPFVIEDLKSLGEAALVMSALAKYDEFLTKMGLLQEGDGTGSGFSDELIIEAQS